MDDSAIVCVAPSSVRSEEYRFRPVSDWEKRAAELATELRRSNRDLRETAEALVQCVGDSRHVPGILHEVQARLAAEDEKTRQRHAQDTQQQLDAMHRQHVQEMTFYLDRMRQQYALDTAAHMGVQKDRLREEQTAALRVQEERLAQEHAQELARRLAEQEVIWAGKLEEAIHKQKEEDDLARAALTVELVAQLKEADERRRVEKRELALELKGQIETARQMVEEVRKERDADRLAWVETRKEIDQMVENEQVLRNRTAEEAQLQVEALRADLAEARKQRENASKKLAAKHAKLQKEHQDLLLIHKQTVEASRELRLRSGRLEVLKETGDQELKNRDRQYADLEKLHERTAQALNGARQDIISLQLRLKEETTASQALADSTQRELYGLRDLLVTATTDLQVWDRGSI